MIINTRTRYLEQLEAEIARDRVTVELLSKCVLDQWPLPDTEMKQFASIVLKDGLVDLGRIEARIAEDEANLKPVQVKAPPAKASIVNVLKEAPKQKDHFITYWKFPVKPLGKEPICIWKVPTNQQKAAFNPRRFNTGILTGARNNLLVVDLDVKDDGVDEFDKHIALHGEPQTVKVQTPTKG